MEESSSAGPVLAIIGSVKFANPNAYAAALKAIVQEVKQLKPVLIVSGGADGIDTFAKTVAELQRIPVQEYLPANHRWEPEGFKERNLLIAESCTHLLAIRCKESKTYGSGWTANQAEKMGKAVKRVLV